MTEILRVLVVDDDPLQLELVERALSRDGFEVHAASTITAMAREVVRFKPQILLLDVNMPEAPDTQVIAIARESAPGARIILYSAWEESRLRALALRLGSDGFISKSESAVAIGRRLRELHKG